MDARRKIGLGLWAALIALGCILSVLLNQAMDRADRLQISGAPSTIEWCLIAVWLLLALVTISYTLWFAISKLRQHRQG